MRTKSEFPSRFGVLNLCPARDASYENGWMYRRWVIGAGFVILNTAWDLNLRTLR